MQTRLLLLTDAVAVAIAGTAASPVPFIAITQPASIGRWLEDALACQHARLHGGGAKDHDEMSDPCNGSRHIMTLAGRDAT